MNSSGGFFESILLLFAFFMMLFIVFSPYILFGLSVYMTVSALGILTFLIILLLRCISRKRTPEEHNVA